MNDQPAAPAVNGTKISAPAILVSVFVIGTCGLLYELLAGTLASYVLGDSVTQFSTIIGVYLFAMGVGAWLSGFIDRDLVGRFIEIEVAVALVGGFSATILFIAFARVEWFSIILYGLVLIIGILVGLEIPLLMRILKDQFDLKDLVARVLTVDYLGALVASLAFPFFVVPRLGLVRGAFAVGVLNALVAVWCTYLLQDAFRRRGRLLFLRAEAYFGVVILAAGFVGADRLTSLAEDAIYADPIVYAKTTPYQRIVVTRGKTGFQLFINGALQLTSADEHRYHEALVHPVVSSVVHSGDERRLRALVLGGGDGLAVRELLRYPQVASVTLVELDPAMTDLARNLDLFVDQNERALHDPRVEVINADAMVWLRGMAERGRASTRPPPSRYDVIIADFPDPHAFSLGKLYTRRFYRWMHAVLTDDGAAVVQATSPLYARRSFWTVASTLEAAGFATRAYHASVPSFGEWGYILARKAPFEAPARLTLDGLRYLTPALMPTLFVFGRDTDRVPTGVNLLNNQVLVQTYEREWDRWN